MEGDGEENITIRLEPDDYSIDLQPTATGCIISARVRNYCPLNVAKAFARLAIMFAPQEDLVQLEHLRQWIHGQTDGGELLWSDPKLLVDWRDENVRSITLDITRVQGDHFVRYDVAVGYGLRLFVCCLPDRRYSAKVDYEGTSDLVVHNCSATKLDSRRESVEYVTDSGHFPRPNHEQVATAAYFRWLDSGRPQGTAQVDWLAAQRHLYLAAMETHGTLDDEKSVLNSRPADAYHGSTAERGEES